ncbi:MAG: hypothetical protein DWQ07_18110 [Chloroflexi bacterium]|nr:MAG: hypothetical protein DWQ07_18110 [Chloroflexota bacterium]
MLLSACQPQLAIVGLATPSSRSEPLLDLATRDPISSNTPTATITQQAQLSPTATMLPDPFDLLSTQVLKPEVAWRPPLYPVPWALGPNDHFFFTRPLQADQVNWPLPDYRYGATNFGLNRPHTGVEFVVPKGTPIYAAGPGKILWAGRSLFQSADSEEDPYGIAVLLRHDFGFNNRALQTVYAHLSGVAVEFGQIVESGDLIGYAGATGLVTGPHLHFEVRINVINDFFSTLNPELWLAPPQGWGVLAGRVSLDGLELLHLKEIRVISKDRNQEWFVNTYGSDQTINSDPYYKENFVLSDIPAGPYYLLLEYLDEVYRLDFEILPGAITYFSFSGVSGMSTQLPGISRPTNLPIISP